MWMFHWKLKYVKFYHTWTKSEKRYIARRKPQTATKDCKVISCRKCQKVPGRRIVALGLTDLFAVSDYLQRFSTTSKI